MATNSTHKPSSVQITSEEGNFPVINPNSDPIPFETKTVDHGNGTTEIVRIIDDDNLQTWSKSNPLAFEASIIWLVPIEDQPYVRVALIGNAETRRGKLMLDDGKRKTVGYSRLN